MNAITGFAGAVLVLTVGSVADDQREDKPRFKGVELYSWQDPAGDWVFALLDGTNRLKATDEVKGIQDPLKGVAALKKALVLLAVGEHVSWTHPIPGFAFPPEATCKEIATWAKDAKLELAIADPKVQEAASVQAVVIDTPNFWSLHLAPDGSGYVGYGAGTAAGFKAGTLDFATVVKDLRRITTKEPPKGGCFSVMFREKGVVPAYVYTNDSKLVLALFDKAARKEVSEGRSDEFDQEWKDHPPAMKR